LDKNTNLSGDPDGNAYRDLLGAFLSPSPDVAAEDEKSMRMFSQPIGRKETSSSNPTMALYKSGIFCPFLQSFVFVTI
jgi:hypothetical protein